MKKSLSDFVNVFSKVTTAICIAAAVFILIFWGKDVSLGVEILWQILGFSALCTFASFIMPWDDETENISKKEMFIRIILSFAAVNIIVLGCGFWFEWFQIENKMMVVGMEILIILAFAGITGISYWKEDRETEKINQRLRNRLKHEEIDEKVGNE